MGEREREKTGASLLSATVACGQTGGQQVNGGLLIPLLSSPLHELCVCVPIIVKRSGSTGTVLHFSSTVHHGFIYICSDRIYICSKFALPVGSRQWALRFRVLPF